MNERRVRVDCIGLRCPEPILNTAKAALGLGSFGGVLEVHADDAAFPIDLKSWCRSTNAELVSLEQQDQTFHAVVRVPQKKATPPPIKPIAPVPLQSAAPTVLDYRGRRCPEPIVELAK